MPPSWRGTSNGALCDECVGTYVVVDAGVATSTLSCAPKGACSISAAHTDVGTLTLDGGSLTYVYNFGSWTGTITAQSPGDVCAIVDAGGAD